VPEGDTIFRAARTLHKALSGKTVTRFETVLALLARVDDQSPIAGRRIEEVRAAGKHLLFEFSGDLFLRTHMRMSGSWHIYRIGERWQRPRRDMRIVVETADFAAVGFSIPVAELIDRRALERHDELRRLGPDLLGSEIDEQEIIRRIRERNQKPIGELLLNQRVAAGIGNVYKNEVLFLCGVHPHTIAAQITDDQIRGLFATAATLMRANVRDGTPQAITTYTGLRRTTHRSDPSSRLWVYSRGGEPCRKCGTPIEFSKDGDDARVTYWCPSCQRM